MSTLDVRPISISGPQITFQLWEGQLHLPMPIGSDWQRLGASTIGAQQTGTRAELSSIIWHSYNNTLSVLTRVRDTIKAWPTHFVQLIESGGLFGAQTVHIKRLRVDITGGRYAWNGTAYTYRLTAAVECEAVNNG